MERKKKKKMPLLCLRMRKKKNVLVGVYRRESREGATPRKGGTTSVRKEGGIMS